MLWADMEQGGATAILGAVTGLVIAVSGLVAVVAKLWRRDDVTDRRVDLMWEAYLRRGSVEAASKKLVLPSPRSPSGDPTMPTLRDDVRAAYEPIAPALRQLYQREGKGLTEGQLAEKIEARFGAWLSRHICAVLGVTEFACLEMARIVATEPELAAATSGASAPAAPAGPP